MHSFLVMSVNITINYFFKLHSFGYISVADSMGLTLNGLTYIAASKSYRIR